MTQISYQFPLSEERGVDGVSLLSESDDSDFEVVEETSLWDSMGSEGSSGSLTPNKQCTSTIDFAETPLSFVPSHEIDSGKPYAIDKNLDVVDNKMAFSEEPPTSKVTPEVKNLVDEEKEATDMDHPLNITQERLSTTDSLGLHASAFEENLRFTLENSTFDSITFELPLTLRILFTGSGANGEDKEPILEKISHSLARLFEPSPTTSQTMSSSSSLLGSRHEFGINYVVLPMSVLLGRDDLRNSVVRYEDSGVYIQVGDFIGRSASDTLHYVQSLEASFLSSAPSTGKNVVDVCFYFISPFPNNEDINEMVLVSRRVNVVPIIVGTEALNVDEIVECRRSILEILEKNEVDIKSFTDSNILLTHGWLKNKGDICGETILTTTEFTLLDSQCVYHRILEFHVNALQSAAKRAAFDLKRRKRQSLRWFSTLMLVLSLVLWILLPIPGLDHDDSEENIMQQPNASVLLKQTTAISSTVLLPQPSHPNSVSMISKPSTDLMVYSISLPISRPKPGLQKFSTKFASSDLKVDNSAQALLIPNVTEQLEPQQHLVTEGQNLADSEPTPQPTNSLCLLPTRRLVVSSDSLNIPDIESSEVAGQVKKTNVQRSEECTASVQCMLLKARKSLSAPIKESANYILQMRSKIRSTAFTALSELVDLYMDFAHPHFDWYIERVLYLRASIRQKLSTAKVHFGIEYIQNVDGFSEPLISKVVQMRRVFRERISSFKEKLLKVTRTN